MLAIIILLLIGFTVGPYLRRKYKRSVKNEIFRTLGVYAEGGEWRRLKMWCMYVMLMTRRLVQRWTDRPIMYNREKQKEYEEKEKPQVLDESDPYSIDCVYFYGGSGDLSTSDGGLSFIVRLARRPNRVAELWFIVRLADGSVLEHPLQPDTHVTGGEANNFTAAGFRITCLEPMRRWRLSYSGLMRRGAQKDLSKHDSTSEDDFVTLNLKATFRAGTNAHSSDLHPRMLANSIAREPWTWDFFGNLALQSYRNRHIEQWGRINGTMEINGQCEELDMHAYRDHSYGRRNWNDFHRYAAHFGCLEDGTTFSLGAVSIPSITSHLRYGYLNTAYGNTEDIHEHNLSLCDVGEFNAPPDNYNITFITSNKEHHVTVKAQQPSVTLFVQPNWDVVIFERFSEFVINGKRGWGVTEFLYRYPRGYPIERLSPVSLIIPEPLSVEDTNLLVVSLNHSASADQQLCGGKGAQLGLLNLMQEVDVPPGAVITTKAYEKLLACNVALTSAIENLTTQCCNAEGIESIRATCENMNKYFINAVLPDEVLRDLRNALNSSLGSQWTEQRVSVRSSAAGEDGNDASSAGQMQTYLGIRGEAQIVEHIKLCWASLFGLQAVEYRRQHGQPITTVMAVVVQQMVDADVSGVLFTNDPLSGNANTIFVNASYGLGEIKTMAIVSGNIEPDTFVVRRHFTNDHLSILDRKVGEKTTSYVMQDSFDGVKTESVDDGKAARLCLQDDVVLRLAGIGVQIEKRLGSPRDIEFAISNEKIYILQARPITTFEIESDKELIHEFDSAVMCKKEFITNNNIGEMCPNAVTPLTYSVFAQSIEKCLQYQSVCSFDMSNYCYPQKSVYNFCNHLFINLYFLGLETENRNILGNRNMLMVALFGEVLPEPTIEEFAEYTGNVRSLQKISSSILKILADRNANKETKQWEKKLRDGYAIPKRFIAEEQFEAIDERIEDYYDCWRISVQNTKQSSVGSMFLLNYLSSITKSEWDNELFSQLALLLSSCDDVYSADVPKALKNLAQEIAEKCTSEEKSTFLRLSAEEAAQWCFTKASGQIGRQFRQFLQRHGHRCVREAEFRETSWNTEPAKIISAVKSMIETNAYKSVEKQILSPEEVIEQLPFTPKWWQHKILLRLIRWARKGVGKREWGKSISIEMVDVFKEAYRRLGHLLHQEGLLPDADLAYFFTHYELGQVAKGCASPQLLSKAARRRRILHLQSKMEFNNTFRGTPNSIDHLHNSRDSGVVSSGQKITGMPVSRGTVTGSARVVRSLHEAASIQRGDVLIVPYTDVGWTPYFPLISGLVTEKGGLLSHGAVVAREYGIPCVVNVSRATSLIRTGNHVELNGTYGTIAISD